MQRRQFLEDCDLILNNIPEYGKRGHIPEHVIKKVKPKLRLLLGYMIKRGHIELYGETLLSLKPDGDSFRSQTSYVKEYDDSYEKNNIERQVLLDKPEKIIREKRTLWLLAIGAFLTILGLVLAQWKCKG